jgi:hypothetical protein
MMYVWRIFVGTLIAIAIIVVRADIISFLV